MTYLKTLLAALMALLAACSSSYAQAEEETPPPYPGLFPEDRERPQQFERGARPGERRGEGERLPMGGEGLEAVERFLSMPPDKLAKLRQLITRIEQMSPEEKTELRQRIQEMQQMSGAKRRQLMDMQEQLPWEDRMLLRQYLRSLPEERRAELRQQMRDLSAEERLAQAEALISEARESGFEAQPMRQGQGQPQKRPPSPRQNEPPQ